MLSLIRVLVLITSAVSIVTAQGPGFPSNPNCRRGNANTASAISRRQGDADGRIKDDLTNVLTLVAVMNLIEDNKDECQCEPGSYWVDVYNNLGLKGPDIQAYM